MSEADQAELERSVEQVLDNKMLNVSVEAQTTDELPVTITLPEFIVDERHVSTFGRAVVLRKHARYARRGLVNATIR
jgi:hypothetical protein